jgi:hypothetical protein
MSNLTFEIKEIENKTDGLVDEKGEDHQEILKLGLKAVIFRR